jgi:molecular chaperone HtpG
MAEVETSARTYGFQAEVKQLLHLMVHSLYSEREIFLRELISNASDANDKLRFEAIENPRLLGDDSDLAITVTIDPEAGVLSVADNGIGMTEAEIRQNLGTIAHSGTGRFLEQLTGDARADSRLIGQFGVGFYSSFIVAREVEVISRRAGVDSNLAVRWRSDGRGEYEIDTVESPLRGTEVRLTLKDDAQEFLDSFRIRALIRKYSDHIAFPVTLVEPGPESDDENAESTKSETVNDARALWTRPRSEVSNDEYLEFYKHIAHDFAEPLSWSHNRVEGKREYTSLLYIPSVAPFDLWNREAPKGLKLYVQRVFITDHATHFLPLYLRFVRGVVDSRDISLNVSRELLQQDPHVGAIRTALTRRVLDMIGRLAKDEPEKFATFCEQFGEVLKEGLAEDAANKERIAALLRFHSTASDADAADRSLDQYIEDAGEERSEIYYLVADSLSVARSSPHLEVFKDKGVEVLLLTDRIDEWMLQHLKEYRGKQMRDVTRGELNLDGAESSDAKSQEDSDSTENPLISRIRDVLGDRVDSVRASQRLRESPACLVLSEHDPGYQMREMLKAAGHDAPISKPILEVNLDHPLVRRLEREAAAADFERLALLVLDLATLAEGRQLTDPAAYTRRLNDFLLALGLDEH